MRDWKNTEATPGMAAIFYAQERVSENTTTWHTVVGEIIESQRKWMRIKIMYSESSDYELDSEHTLSDDNLPTLEIRPMEWAGDLVYQSYIFTHGPARQYLKR